MFQTNNIKFSSTEIFVLFLLFIYLFFQIDFVKYGQYIQASSILIFAISAFIGVMTYMNQENDRSKMMGIQYSNLTQSKMHEIDKLFMMNPNLTRLYFELYQNDPTIMKIKKNIGDSYEILKAEHHGSIIIFQTIADIYACDLIKPDADGLEWRWTFKQWLKSPILQNHWVYLQKEQHPEVRKFINGLINENKLTENKIILMETKKENGMILKENNNPLWMTLFNI